MHKRWNVKADSPADKVRHLAEAIRVDPVIANLLVQRGVDTYDQAKHFFRPGIDSLHKPSLMKDMEKAVKRIADAAMNQEKILVYGDYDVDGTTAVSVVYTFLKWLGMKCDFYIPDRYKEGYGVSTAGVDYAVEHGFKLIVALDCGIKAHDKVKYAKEKGVDFIICDHHKPDKTLPEAVAILNPKREDCSYPYKELPGVGIGFKLVQALAENYDIPFSHLEQYLDVVALGIASDIVPITGENRILAHHGLKRINSSPRPGFKAIIDIANIKKEITVNDLVFVFGPRINSAGRIESGKSAVELLISDTPEKAKLSGESINKTNFERRDVDTAITQEAIAMIDNDEAMRKRKTTVLYKPDWHKGVIGIVASRLIEKHYYRPTIILTKSNGVLSGSARSVRNFDLYEALDECSGLLEQFGGHKYAAGLTMKEENLPAFIKMFEEVVSKNITDDLLQPEIEIDSILHLSKINFKFYNVLHQFAPFGPGNMTPVFWSEDVIAKRDPMIVGQNHLRMPVAQADSPETQFYCIGFDMGHLLPIASKGKPFKICYSIRENEWMGEKKLELNIRDIKA
jgi:single-stranded-DNA-specific exonuclease